MKLRDLLVNKCHIANRHTAQEASFSWRKPGLISG